MLLIFSLHASTGEKPAVSFPLGAGFMKNRGQVVDQSGKCAAPVLYVINRKEDKFMEKEEEEGLAC